MPFLNTCIIPVPVVSRRNSAVENAIFNTFVVTDESSKVRSHSLGDMRYAVQPRDINCGPYGFSIQIWLYEEESPSPMKGM